ncbi:MAG: radical SAM protein [Ardenticatenaceae bacterium]|nr:radical SAM protein [Anaerolineales bacterium]MCB8942070.1 radical SAM protein [Ardenticatenaceae bacterium]MCB8973170.1 radical SAM protein [Ardenticatenaceae bacterium]
MFYNWCMTDAFVKLQEIAVNMHLEPAEETNLNPAPEVAPCGQVVAPRSSTAQPRHTAAKQAALGISHAVMPGGKTMPQLKTLLTTACERNCYYCPFRAGRNYKRHTFQPEELAKAFMQMYRAGLVEGLFLSSGIIKGSVATQDKILETAEILRQKHQFKGYIHLKVMPGVEKDQLRHAMTLADRLSVNLEAPNDKRLALLAPKKVFFEELVRPLQIIEQIRQEEPAHLGWNGRWPSTVTQFVVGAVGETDVEILSTTEYFTKQLHIQRAYFSAFSPIPDTPLENHPAENPMRKVRLYQTSFLFRDYDFGLEEMPFDQQGNLPLDIDPKLAWAKDNLSHNPVELNRAHRDELLRVPGIGPKHSHTILNARRRGQLRELNHLRQLGIATKRLAPYVLLDGKRPNFQLPLDL